MKCWRISVELTKVAAASRQGANIFLLLTIQSPRKQKADPNAKSNYETALEAAKNDRVDRDENHLVKTLQDAID